MVLLLAAEPAVWAQPDAMTAQTAAVLSARRRFMAVPVGWVTVGRGAQARTKNCICTQFGRRTPLPTNKRSLTQANGGAAVSSRGRQRK